MKDSGVEWLGEISSGWQLFRLGHLFRERREKVSDKDFPPLSVTKQGIVPQLETAAKSDDGDNRKLVRAGDFVINSRSDRKGSSGLSRLDGSVSLINIVLEPRRIVPDFSHHLLRSYAFQEEFYRWGHGIVADLWTTCYSEMKDIRVLLPDRNSQQSIANFLDRETARIDQLIEKKQRLVELLEEKAKSFVEIALNSLDSAHCQISKLGFFVTKVGSGKTPRGGAETYVESGVAFLRSQNVHNDGLRLDQVAYIDENTDEEMKNTRVQHGDVLLNITGGSLGRCAVARQTDLPANVSQHVSIIRASKRLNSEFLHLQLLSKRVQDIIRLESFSANREGLTANDIKNLIIAVPKAIQSQHKIAEDVIRKRKLVCETISAVRDSIDRLREFRSVLITAAVTGQIDVNEWSCRGHADAKLDAITKEMEA